MKNYYLSNKKVKLRDLNFKWFFFIEHTMFLQGFASTNNYRLPMVYKTLLILRNGLGNVKFL